MPEPILFIGKPTEIYSAMTEDGVGLSDAVSESYQAVTFVVEMDGMTYEVLFEQDIIQPTIEQIKAWITEKMKQ